MLLARHPAGGYLEFVSDSEFAALRCLWPFDLFEGEWITIQNRYHASGFRRAVDSAMSHDVGKAQGVGGGFLEIASVGDGYTINFSRPQTGWLARSLQLNIGRPLAELRRLLDGRLHEDNTTAWPGQITGYRSAPSSRDAPTGTSLRFH